MRVLVPILGLAGLALASQAADAPVPTAQGTPPAEQGFTETRSQPSRLHSPIGDFRDLLAMTPAAREQALVEKSEHHRQYLQAKLQEYESLTPDERELRLRATQLRWSLLPLMQLAPAGRAERLASVLEEDRKLVEERLKQWDLLSPVVQKELLENQMTIDYFVQLETSTPAQREIILKRFSPERRAELEEDIAQWRASPADQRQRMVANFNQFFKLSEKEKGKILATFSQSERQRMQKTLDAFEKLPSEQRTHCIESFHKFSNMTPAERNQFLQNAERWESMTPGERESWRNLVSKLPPLPPLPPGLEITPPATKE